MLYPTLKLQSMIFSCYLIALATKIGSVACMFVKSFDCNNIVCLSDFIKTCPEGYCQALPVALNLEGVSIKFREGTWHRH